MENCRNKFKCCVGVDIHADRPHNVELSISVHAFKWVALPNMSIEELAIIRNEIDNYLQTIKTEKS